MRYGISIPNFGTWAEPRTLVGLARDAEAAGWDGFFLWDHILPEETGMPLADAWITLAAIAQATDRLRLGPLVTPLPRRRPWKVAREAVTLDHLSGGRLVLPVGLGAVETFGPVGEVTDRTIRARMLDESLEILTGLWSGRSFGYEGEHYRLEEMTFLPRPVQRPRVPIWVVGAWPSGKSMRRALRYDGLLAYTTRGEVTPEDIRAMKAYVEENRPQDASFDIVWEGETPGEDPERAASVVRPFAEAGITWWMEAPWSPPNEPDDLRARIRQGPPSID